MQAKIFTQKNCVKSVGNTHPTNQKSERLWKYIVRPIRDTNDGTSHHSEEQHDRGIRQKQNGRRSAKICTPWRNNRWLHRWARKKTRTKNRQRRKPAKPFLQRKVKLRNVEEIPPAQLNVLLSDFLLTARSKDGNDQVATSRPRKWLRVWSSSSDEHERRTML